MKDKRLILVGLMIAAILGVLLYAHFSHHGTKAAPGSGQSLTTPSGSSSASASPTFTPPAQPVGPAFPASLKNAADRFTVAMNSYSWHDGSIQNMYNRAQKYALPNRIQNTDAGDPQTWKAELVDVHGVVAAVVTKAETFNRVPVKMTDTSAIVRVWFSVTTTQDGQAASTQSQVWDETFAKQSNGAWLLDSYQQNIGSN